MDSDVYGMCIVNMKAVFKKLCLTPDHFYINFD